MDRKLIRFPVGELSSNDLVDPDVESFFPFGQLLLDQMSLIGKPVIGLENIAQADRAGI